MNQAILYARFSTPSQEKGDSLNRQLSDCRAFCERHGLVVVDEVTDLGRSAYKGDHLSIGNLGKLTARILAGEIPKGTTLVFEKFDRLSRQKPRIVQRWIEDVCDHGLRIAVLDGEKFIDARYLDEGSNMLALLDILMSSHASNIFSKNLSDRISKAWRTKKEAARKEGIAPTKTLPAWLYMDEKGKVQLDRKRQAIVERIFEMTAEGVGAWTIANTFNDECIPSWGVNRKQKAAKVRGWNNTYIRMVINHPAVEGDHHFTVPKGKGRVRSNDVVRGLFPRAVNADLVARARKAVERRGAKSGGRFASYGRNLFAGIAHCDECGSKMILTGRGLHSDKPAYPQCDSAKRRKGCTNRACFDYKTLEPVVLEKVLHVALDDRFFRSDNEHVRDLAEAVAQAEKALSDADALRQGYGKLFALRPDDTRLQSDYEQASLECDKLERAVAYAKQKLAAAKGSTSPQEHIARVREVQSAIQSEDEEVMQTARRRVHASLQEVITHMRCCTKPVEGRKLPSKFTQIALADGLITFTVDQAGKITQAQDFTNSPEHVHGLTTGPVSYNKPVVEAIQQRA